MTCLCGQRVVVMGLGRFGGGAGAARFAVRQGADVLVTDTASADQLACGRTQLAGLPIEYRLGEHKVDDFKSADLIIVNPAVNRQKNRFLQAAAQAGVPTTSEIRLLVQCLPVRARTVGVTGTAGKSTVTAMISYVLSHEVGKDHVHVGGNLGGSLLNALDQIHDDDWVVLELSSFMLEGLAEDCWSPHIAVLTNFSPNHLDRHGTLDAYRSAKQGIFDHQGEADYAIMRGTDRAQFQLVQYGRPDSAILFEPTPDAYLKVALTVPGCHNRMNAVLACGAVRCAGVAWARAERLLSSFSGLPHRLQFVCTHGQVRYYNDSKSTTPESAHLALASFKSGIVHAILGGYDKGSDLVPLAGMAAQHCRAVYTIGATGQTIAAACVHASGGAEVLSCQTLQRAMAQMAGRLRRGDVVLLSPGCASWDQFDHYEQRGTAFIDAVRAHGGHRAPSD